MFGSPRESFFRVRESNILFAKVGYYESSKFKKSNFRQYGQMEKQRWEESAKRREEERRWEKRQSQKKEDATLTQPLQFRNRPPDKLAPPSIFRGTFCPAKQDSCIRYLSKTHFARDVRQKVKAEDVKTKLSCETSLKKWEWKIWKRSFCARLFLQNLKVEDVKTKLSCKTIPSKSESGRCENEACVRDFLQILKV